jgi:tetratricopeptide (TPR) repeat protein
MSDTKNDAATLELMRAKLEAQKKDKLLHLVMGLFVGLLVGFFGANWMNSNPATVGAPAASTAAGDDGHTHDDAAAPAGGGASGAAMPEVQAKLKAADDNPQDYQAQVDAAAMFYRINNYDRAITYLERARKLKPDDVDTTVYLANTYYDAGRFGEAKPLYEEAVQKKPNDVDIRTDLGSTLFNLNEPDKAIETYRASLKLDPKHEKTIQNLAMVLLKKGDAAGAEDAINQLATVSPQNSSLADLRKQLNDLKTTGKIPTH